MNSARENDKKSATDSKAKKFGTVAKQAKQRKKPFSSRFSYEADLTAGVADLVDSVAKVKAKSDILFNDINSFSLPESASNLAIGAKFLSDGAKSLIDGANSLLAPIVNYEKTLPACIGVIQDSLSFVHAGTTSIAVAKGNTSDIIYQTKSILTGALSIVDDLNTLDIASKETAFVPWLEQSMQTHSVALLELVKINKIISEIKHNFVPKEVLKEVSEETIADLLNLFEKIEKSENSETDLKERGCARAKKLFKKIGELQTLIESPEFSKIEKKMTVAEHANMLAAAPLLNTLNEMDGASLELVFWQIAELQEKRRIFQIENEISARIKVNLHTENWAPVKKIIDTHSTTVLTTKGNTNPYQQLVQDVKNAKTSFNPTQNDLDLETTIQASSEKKLASIKKMLVGDCLRLASIALFLTASILGVSAGLAASGPVILPIIAVATLIAFTTPRFFPELESRKELTAGGFLKNMKNRVKNINSSMKIRNRADEIKAMQKSLASQPRSASLPAVEKNLIDTEQLKPVASEASLNTALQNIQRNRQKNTTIKRALQPISRLELFQSVTDTIDSLALMSAKLAIVSPLLTQISQNSGAFTNWIGTAIGTYTTLLTQANTLASPVGNNAKQVKLTAEMIQDSASFIDRQANEIKSSKGKTSDLLTQAQQTVYSALGTAASAADLAIAAHKMTFEGWLAETMKERSRAMLDFIKINESIRDNPVRLIALSPLDDLLNQTDSHILATGKKVPEKLDGWQYAKQAAAFLDQMNKLYQLSQTDPGKFSTTVSIEDKKILDTIQPWLEKIASLNPAEHEKFLLQIAYRHTEIKLQHMETQLITRLKTNLTPENHQQVKDILNQHIPEPPKNNDESQTRFLQNVSEIRADKLPKPTLEEKNDDQKIRIGLASDFQNKKNILLASTLNLVSVSTFLTIGILGIASITAPAIVLPLLSTALLAAFIVKKYFPKEEKAVRLDIAHFFSKLKRIHKTEASAKKLLAKQSAPDAEILHPADLKKPLIQEDNVKDPGSEYIKYLERTLQTMGYKKDSEKTPAPVKHIENSLFGFFHPVRKNNMELIAELLENCNKKTTPYSRPDHREICDRVAQIARLAELRGNKQEINEIRLLEKNIKQIAKPYTNNPSAHP